MKTFLFDGKRRLYIPDQTCSFCLDTFAYDVLLPTEIKELKFSFNNNK